MSWEDVTSTAIDIKKTKGVPHEGIYFGSKEITTKIGKQVIWNFEGEDGNFGIYGFTNLNRAMSALKEGTKVQITYRGTLNVPTKFGNKDVHQVDVRRWVDDGAHEVGEDDDFSFAGAK